MSEKEMTQEEILRARMMGNPENPPPYSGDTQLWAEDLDNYLRRRMQHLEDRVSKAVTRISRMEALTNERSSDEATRTGAEGPATHTEGT